MDTAYVVFWGSLNGGMKWQAYGDTPEDRRAMGKHLGKLNATPTYFVAVYREDTEAITARLVEEAKREQRAAMSKTIPGVADA
ncbi:MAG TPA: hypothetical protein VFL91_08285 [Thermomicrobiales bacterium]|nr:hypothetical protein [Thermomicrobiales bacterium]